MDEFFQKLREIQKKERNLSGLAPVGENFYQNISKYFNVLMRKIDDNPFSFESYLLRDAQRITAEICERREHKISNSAVMSVQRSYQLFKESEPDSPNHPKIPRNSTPEEEKLFHALVDSLIIYREKMRGPLRFQNPQTRDKSSHIPDGGIEDEGNSFKKVAGDGTALGTPDTRIDKSDTALGMSDTGIDTSNTGIDKSNSGLDTSNTELDKSDATSNGGGRDENKGFTAEEEAALEDDFYKQFGREPFPGSSGKSSKDSSRDRKALNSESSHGNSESSSKTDSPDKNVGLSKNPPTEQSDIKDIQTDVLLVLEELPSIMGVDKKVYGPLLPQDIVTIPEPNARILIKNQKGKSIQKYK